MSISSNATKSVRAVGRECSFPDARALFGAAPRCPGPNQPARAPDDPRWGPARKAKPCAFQANLPRATVGVPSTAFTPPLHAQIAVDKIERFRTAEAAAKNPVPNPKHERWAARPWLLASGTQGSGVALHPEFASLGYALAGFVTDASGPPQREPLESRYACRADCQ